jgi:hypothetical protein
MAMGSYLLGIEQIWMIVITCFIVLIVIAALIRRFAQMITEGECPCNRQQMINLHLSSPNLMSAGGSKKSKDTTPKVAGVLRYLVYLGSVAYSLHISITQVLAPQLNSEQCKYVGKVAFTLYSLEKVMLYAFLFAKARVVQVVVQPKVKCSIVNIATIVGIVCVLCYPIASWVVFDGKKIPFISQNCIFITPTNFYVLFIVSSVHDMALSCALLYQFVRPLQEHLENFKTTRKFKSEDNGLVHLQKVVRVNTLFGIISMASTIVSFGLMAWITFKKDLYLASNILPLATLGDLLLSTISVFVISTPPLWKCLFCIKQTELVAKSPGTPAISEAGHDPEEVMPLKGSTRFVETQHIVEQPQS